MQPFFSVIIPTYNRSAELLRAVKSVLSQTFSDFEIIIVNNSANEIILPIKDERIKLFYQKIKGANYARNIGIENSSTGFICFLDDDDEYLPNHLEILYDLIKKNHQREALYRTYAKIETKKNELIIQPIFLLKDNQSQLEHIYSTLLFMGCVCIHKNILKEIKFDVSVPVAQDYNLWSRILVKYPLYESAVVTAIYHNTEKSISTPDLKTLINYVTVYENLFSISEIRNQLRNATRNKRVFNYLYLILNTCLAELSFRQFYTYSLKAIKYNPTYFFNILKLKIKFLFLKLKII